MIGSAAKNFLKKFYTATDNFEKSAGQLRKIPGNLQLSS